MQHQANTMHTQIQTLICFFLFHLTSNGIMFAINPITAAQMAQFRTRVALRFDKNRLIPIRPHATHSKNIEIMISISYINFMYLFLFYCPIICVLNNIEYVRQIIASLHRQVDVLFFACYTTGERRYQQKLK